MEFNLTSSQSNFYTKNTSLDSFIWNQGVFEVFPKVFSYRQLNDAYNQLVKANDSLRVKIKETPDGPVTFIEDFEYTDWPFLQVNSEEELIAFAKKFINSETDLYGRLVRCVVFQTPATSGILICAHHIVVDGYSAFVMSEHINQYLKDLNYTPPAQQSYCEYIEKEEKHKKSKRFSADRDFWKEQFEINPVCNMLSGRNDNPSFSAAETDLELPFEMIQNVKDFCSKYEISVATFFNTVYATYFHRAFEHERFTIGVPVLNRTTQAELNTIGLYMHIVPLVVSIQPTTFLENAYKIEDSWLNIFRHQKFTQQDIKQALSAQEGSVNTLFDFAADFLEFKPNADYEVRFLYINSLTTPLEFHLQSFSENHNVLRVLYKTSLFSEQEVRTMANSIIAITKAALEDPHKEISDIDILPAAEKQKLLHAFNDTAHEYAASGRPTLYSLFEAASDENKGKVCITAGDKEITYSDFREYAERIDAGIRSITEEKCVIAVICERSIEMYGAVYGIIRGGNAYLPIDPTYPQERIDYILENSQAKAVVAQDKFCHLAKNIACINASEILASDAQYAKTACRAEENDTAYVIYTSGSTGAPKGAKISHKAAVNRILWMHDKYPLEENDVILQKTPYTFDVSVWELFWWGITGRALCVSKPDEHFLPAKILEETEKNKVTHLHFVPSVFDLFLTYLENNKDERRKFASVRYVFLSGEALTAKHIGRFYKLFDSNKVHLHNLYGPTECAVDVTYYDCSPAETDPVPIGKPIYNTQIHIVDKNGHLVPIGVAGELCIAGTNVGQGYLNNDTLTNEKFIDNPFGVGKLYKTGDLAYWREDGNIVFVGRMDGQIKLHGQRIEIGEIESVIASHADVQNAVVAVKTVADRPLLVAFYCAKAECEHSLRALCESRLPHYMVPSVFACVDEIPLNASGKADRRKLLQLPLQVSVTENKPQPAQNAQEQRICDLFSAELGIAVGRNDDFFVCGGTSLSMISLLSQKHFENITASDFIANATPAKLAAFMQSRQKPVFKILQCLHDGEKAENALVLFPYAGGGAEAFAMLVNALLQRTDAFSIYFVDYLHSVGQCRAAADEIALLCADKKVFFYSHCAGSAVAMQVLNILEKEKQKTIDHFVAGGFIPSAKAEQHNVWRFVPKFLLQSLLKKAGAPLAELSQEKREKMLQQFLTDTDFLFSYFATQPPAISCPVSLLISRQDLFTRNYASAGCLWQQYAENVKYIHYIESQSHYFQAVCSEEAAANLLSMFV